MARDYNAKRVVKRQANPIKRLFTVMVAFVSGYLSATIFDMTSLSEWVSSKFNVQEEPHTQKIAQQEEAPKPKFEFYTILAKGSPKPSEYNAVQKEMSKKIDELTTLQVASKTPAISGTAQSPGIAPTGIPGQQKPQVQALIKQAEPALPHPAPIISTREEPRLNLALASNATREKYAVQIAAFKNRFEAEKMSSKLASKGYITQVAMVNQAGGAWYRVMMGPFDSKDAAIRAQGNIARTERINGMVRKSEG